jgi:3-oxoacyl-[acyl-carrier protein] reductase
VWFVPESVRVVSLLGLERKVAIVTGAAQNIGRAMALELARAGASVVVADLQIAKARKVARDIERLKKPALAVKVDVRDQSQVRELAALAFERFGRIDVLVNNASIVGVRTPIEVLDSEQWDTLLAVCLRSAFFSVQAVVPFMRKRGKGKIINISSAVFWVGAADCAPYISSKGGLIGLTRGLARELGQYNISVNAITPGAVKTPQERLVANQREIDRLVSAQCLRRRVLPVDIANAAVFLASDLSDAITGQTINVDAGWAMH